MKALGAYASGEEFGAAYDTALATEQQKTEEARRREQIAGALIESLPSFIPGYGDVTGLIADLKMYREHPDERTWKNAGLTALGILPIIPSAAGSIRRVDKAIEAAEDGAKVAAKEGEEVARLGTEQAKSSERIEALTKTDPSLDYRANFFDEYPHLANEEIEIHHAIPQRTLTRYPGLMTEVEMHAVENLRGISKSIANVVHRSMIHKDWNRFKRENPTTTRARLEQMKDEIDRKYGHHFVPPISPEGEK